MKKQFGDIAKDVTKKVSKGVNDVAKKASKSANDIAKIASEGAKDVAEKTSKGVNDVTKMASETAKDVAKKASESAKVIGDVADQAKDKVMETGSAIKDKAGEVMTQEKLMETLDLLYKKSIDGVDKVSPPVKDLVRDYKKHNSSIDAAAKSLINNSVIKCGTSGFVTGFGGLGTLVLTLPANVTSVMYVQIRMCCALAELGGYDVNEDQVQTLVYVCLTGSAMTDIVKQTGIKIGKKFAEKGIEKIPGKALVTINQKVGFRLLTKFGETGMINLGKMLPVIGGVIGGGMDVASTKVIGYNAYKVFIKNEMPNNEDIQEIIDTEVNVVKEETQEDDIQEVSFDEINNNLDVDLDNGK